MTIFPYKDLFSENVLHCYNCQYANTPRHHNTAREYTEMEPKPQKGKTDDAQQ